VVVVSESDRLTMLLRKIFILALFLLPALMPQRLLADNIYILNAPGYNEAGDELIAAMEALGHTVTVNSATYQVFPNITSACVDPNGFHWLCLFGDYDYSAMWPDILAFIADGGKVYYNYEVGCCMQSSTGAAALVANITGLPVTVNANDYIGFSGLATGGGWIANLSGCIDVVGAAYKGLDGLPVANQLQADAVINGATPDVSVCENFGYFFTGADIPGNTLNGSLTGMGDINIWYDGSEPWSNGGIDPVNADLVAYFFPNENTTCNLATTGCSNVCPYGNVLGPDLTICENQQVILDAFHPDGIGYLWQDNSTDPTLTINQAGTYYVEVTDGAVSCTDTIHVEEIIVVASASADITICQGLSASLSASGGDTYSWTPAGSLNDPLIQNPQATPGATATYTVTVFVGQCSDTDEVQVTVVEADVDFLSFITPKICDVDGSITISQVSGGSGPYTLALDGVTILQDEIIAVPAGIYELIIEDQVGCSLTEELIVPDNSYDLFLTMGFENPYCATPGSIEIISVSEPIGNLTYFLNNTEEPDGVFDDLPAGNYLVEVTDENGCLGEMSYELVFNPGDVQVDFEATDPICLAPGSVVVTSVSNAQSPWSITLNNDFSLNGVYQGLGSGNYPLQVIDADGCVFTQNISLTQQNPQLTIVLDSLPMICETPGWIQVTNVISGTEPFSITLDDEEITGNEALVDSSLHILNITDANGCAVADTFQVGFVNHTEAIFTPDPYLENVPFDTNVENESVNATSYEWYLDGELISNDSTPSLTFLNPGEFNLSLVAIDELNGCRDSMFYLIYAQPQDAIYIPSAFSPDNDGINDVFFVKGQNISEDGYEFLVFNRYGDVVWRAAGPEDVWTGEHRDGEYYVSDGVYSFIARYKYLGSFDLQKTTGHITVIR
jgi:gliding motility-associated-like protein